MWDPAVYHRFGAERARPFHDLLARVPMERPRAVADLGCGSGELTRTLAIRWPQARIVGVDSSPEMIAEAAAHLPAPLMALGSTAPAPAAGAEFGLVAGVEHGSTAPAPAAGAEFGLVAGVEHGSTAPAPAVGAEIGSPTPTPGEGNAAVGRVLFERGDLRSWRPEPDLDVLVTNAALQWVPDHADLLARWAVELPGGAWIAMQVPGNFDAPSHRLLRAVVRRYTDAPVTREAPVDEPAGYARVLLAAGARVDAWETTYVHLLADDGPDHPVLRWLEGTALRPVKASLDENAWQSFRADLGRELAAAYPVVSGHVAFPFRRIFVVAQTAPRGTEQAGPR